MITEFEHKMQLPFPPEDFQEVDEVRVFEILKPKRNEDPLYMYDRPPTDVKRINKARRAYSDGDGALVTDGPQAARHPALSIDRQGPYANHQESFRGETAHC